MRRLVLLLGFVVSTGVTANPPSISDMVRLPEFTGATISPDGKYVALAAPTENQTGLAVLDISDYPRVKVSAAIKLGDFEHVDDIWWATDKRVLFDTFIQIGGLETRYISGRIYGVDADGRRNKGLAGTNLHTDTVFRSYTLVDLLRANEDEVLVSVAAHDRDWPFAERMNIYSGKRKRVAVSPLENGRLYTDRNHEVRLASGRNDHNELELAWRETVDSDWSRFSFDRGESLIGLDAEDQRILITRAEQGEMGLFAFDPRDESLAPLLTDATVEPLAFIRELGLDPAVAGAIFEVDGIPQNRFIDEESITARAYRMLEGAFPGMHVRITSTTRDGTRMLVAVKSDRQPLRYFIFDASKRQVLHLVDTRNWIDPEQMGERRPIRFKARDGMDINGYLTLPAGSEPKNLPMVVLVHGGPHGVRDTWSWDADAQLLATRGYAVLQVNFRGSDGYGADFETAGYGGWGTAMQDDITDGVRWAIDRGFADAERLCVYGYSFGGYSVLSQLTREPELYRCGFAVVGVYDLNLMYEKGDISERESGINYLDQVLGTDKAVRAEQSPINHVDRIQSALYLVHGKADVRAHVDHYHRLIDALEKHDIPHRKLLVSGERHTFYGKENRTRLANELVEFLDEHLAK